ncbi:hypothetical protein [Streptomyces mayteni]
MVPDLLNDPASYERELRALVVETAPKMFGVVAEETLEDGGRDAAVVAWGLEYEDGRALVLGEGDQRTLRLSSADRAVTWYSRFTGCDIRLVRVD